MALVQSAELTEIIVESGESAKSLNRPGMAKLLALVDSLHNRAIPAALCEMAVSYRFGHHKILIVRQGAC
jgi:hypothetical protein